ncbi:50S ribosomal protein L17 [Chloroflexi bacterium]|nr:50S ribosomal protein L17 [Chloroflexota bacterium]
MRHRLSGRKLGRPTGHRMLMLRTMVTDLLRNESMKTTDSKAKEVRKMAEKVITLGKKGSLHHRRQASALLTDENVVRKVFEELGGRYQDRNGGYTRITKLGPRKGDASEMAVLELIE